MPLHRYNSKKSNRITDFFRGLLQKFFENADYHPIRFYLKSRREQHRKFTF